MKTVIFNGIICEHDIPPDLCWTHENKFGVGGHDLNAELRQYAGKWIYMKIVRHD